MEKARLKGQTWFLYAIYTIERSKHLYEFDLF